MDVRLAGRVSRRERLRTYGHIALIVYALLATHIVMTTYVYQLARIAGGSMRPTLNDRDRVFVNKAAYLIGDPRAGDITMLRYPLDPDRSFAMRVVGEEGDRIQIVDGVVFRNEQRMAETFVAEANRSHDAWGPQVVPQGYYFVMGDNRINSSDSRHWRFVPKKYILGRITRRWWPPFSRVE